MASSYAREGFGNRLVRHHVASHEAPSVDLFGAIYAGDHPGTVTEQRRNVSEQKVTWMGVLAREHVGIADQHEDRWVDALMAQ